MLFNIFNKIICFLVIFSLNVSFSMLPVEDVALGGAGGSVKSEVVSAVVSELTKEQFLGLEKLLTLCCGEIQKIERIFAAGVSVPCDVLGVGGKPLPEMKVNSSKIKKQFLKLQDVFVERFKPKKGVRFTPDFRESSDGHRLEISKYSPGTFVRKGYVDFERTIEPETFRTVIETHYETKFYIPEYMLNPKNCFALWRESKSTLLGVTYGSFNVTRLLDGKNPCTKSGRTDLHHAFQNPEVVFPLCAELHQKESKQFHRAKGKSRINRTTFREESKIINKMVGFIQVARMCANLLDDAVTIDLSDSTKDLIRFAASYKGNTDVIPGAAATTRKKVLTIPDAFARAFATLDADNSEDGEGSESDDDTIPTFLTRELTPPSLLADDDDDKDEASLFSPTAPAPIAPPGGSASKTRTAGKENKRKTVCGKFSYASPPRARARFDDPLSPRVDNVA